MPKTSTKTNSGRTRSSAARSVVWLPEDIFRAGGTETKDARGKSSDGQPRAGNLESVADRQDDVAREGGGHTMLDDQYAVASPTNSERAAETPVVFSSPTADAAIAAGSGHQLRYSQGKDAAPTTDAAPADGESQDISDAHTQLALPISSVPRKRGRPRKTQGGVVPDSSLSSVAPNIETPQVTAVGGGHAVGVIQSDDASPTPNSDDETTSMMPSDLALSDVAPPSPAPTGGRQRRSEVVPEPNSTVTGAAPTPARRGRPPRQANMPVSTGSTLSAVAPIADPALPAGRGQKPPDTQAGCASPKSIGDGGPQAQAKFVAEPRAGSPDLSSVVAELQELQKKRIFCIKSLMRQSSATLALLRTLLGWTYGGNETENGKINKRARELVKHIEAQERVAQALNVLSSLPDTASEKQRKAAEKGLASASLVASRLKPLEGTEKMVSLHYRQVILASAQANAPWETLREEYEDRMRVIARSLPVYTWVDGVRGLAEIGLAKIIGEAGDLSKYDNPAKLWKRLGLAVIDGRRQGDPGPGASAEDWTEHGYNPKRRSEIWNIADSLIRAQWRGAKEDEDTGEITDGYPLGKYGEMYAARKAYEQAKNEAGDYADVAAAIVARSRSKGKAAPENMEGRLTRKHIDSRARRYVTKKLIKHLWQRWRNPAVPETDVHTA